MRVIKVHFYLHSSKILYRDLKPENILIQYADSNYSRVSFVFKCLFLKFILSALGYKTKRDIQFLLQAIYKLSDLGFAKVSKV